MGAPITLALVYRKKELSLRTEVPAIKKERYEQQIVNKKYNPQLGESPVRNRE